MAEERSAAGLKKGETGVISGYSDHGISLKLMEMGCLPGASIKKLFSAPFGDPLVFEVAGYQLSLRRIEAASIRIESP